MFILLAGEPPATYLSVVEYSVSSKKAEASGEPAVPAALSVFADAIESAVLGAMWCRE